MGRLRRLATLPLRLAARVASKAIQAVDARLSPPPPPPPTFVPPPRTFGHGPVPPLPQDDETPDLELPAEVVLDRQRAGEPILLVDVREPEEVARTGLVEGALHVPLGQLEERRAQLPGDRKLVLYCSAGVRSFDGARHLREHGLEDSWSVAGGLPALLRAGATLGSAT